MDAPTYVALEQQLATGVGLTWRTVGHARGADPQAGVTVLLVATYPTDAFWTLWAQSKPQLREMGCSVIRTAWAQDQQFRYTPTSYKDKYFLYWRQRIIPVRFLGDETAGPAGGGYGETSTDLGTLQLLARVILQQLRDHLPPVRPTPLWSQLKLHQRRAARFVQTRYVAGRAGALLGLDPGLGKTLTTLAALEQCAQAEPGRRFLILMVAPPDLKAAWARDIRKFRLQAEWVCHDYTDLRREGRLPAADGCHRLVTVSYQMAALPPNLERLVRLPWDFLVYDESHRTKNRESVTARALVQLSQCARFRIALSGTAWHDHWRSLHQQGVLLEPELHTGLTAHRAASLAAEAGAWRSLWRGLEWGEAEVLDAFREVNAAWWYLITKQEVADVALPAVRDFTHFIALSPRQRQVYREAAEIEEPEPGAEEDPRHRTFPKLHRLRRWCGLQKREAFAHLLRHPRVRPPLLVFAFYQAELRMVAEEVRVRGWRYAEKSQRPDRPDRPALRTEPGREMEMHPALEVLGLGVQASVEGLDLYRAHTIIFLSFNYSGGAYVQARARIHRIGQQAPEVHFHHLVLERTVDSTIYATLGTKTYSKAVYEELVQARRDPADPAPLPPLSTHPVWVGPGPQITLPGLDPEPALPT